MAQFLKTADGGYINVNYIERVSPDGMYAFTPEYYDGIATCISLAEPFTHESIIERDSDVLMKQRAAALAKQVREQSGLPAED